MGTTNWEISAQYMFVALVQVCTSVAIRARIQINDSELYDLQTAMFLPSKRNFQSSVPALTDDWNE